MKYLLPILSPLLLAGCLVTSSDLKRIEAKLEDESATVEDVQAEIAAVADDVEQRADDLLKNLAGTGGVTGLLTGLGLNLYRNHTRRKALGQNSN